jgi:peptidoglycan/LPS O-acetylase OafA/YrhL
MAAVNGALWTLKIEVMFYLMVPFFVFLLRRFSPSARARIDLLSVACLCRTCWQLQRQSAPVPESTWNLARQLPGQLSYFMAGAFFYYFLPQFERRRIWSLLAATLVLAVNTIFPLPLP